MAQPHGEAAGYYQNTGDYNTASGQGYEMRGDDSQKYGYGQQNNQPQYNNAQQYNQQQYDGSNYAQPQQQPPNYGYQQPPPPPQNYDGKPAFEDAFKIEKPKYNDLWAGILFIAVFLGFTAVSGIALQGYSATRGTNGGGIYDGNNDFSLSTNTIVLFVFCLAVALVLSYTYIWLARIFTKQFIWITGILNIVFAFVTAIYMLSRKYWSGGIVFAIFAIFYVIAFISWIPRIPFSVVMLQTAIDVSKKFGHVYLVSLIGGLLATAFGAW